jgi:hypothetical protein
MQVRIAIGGDIIFGKGVSQIARARGLGYFFEPIAPMLRAADWTVLNMEGCISTRGAPLPKEYTFRAPPDLAAHLRLAGVSMVSLGNNHSMDYGATALLDTMDYLWRAGVWWAGRGGEPRSRRRKPVSVDFGGLRVAFVCFTAVVPRGFPCRRAHAWRGDAGRRCCPSCARRARTLTRWSSSRTGATRAQRAPTPSSGASPANSPTQARR